MSSPAVRELIEANTELCWAVAEIYPWIPCSKTSRITRAVERAELAANSALAAVEAQPDPDVEALVHLFAAACATELNDAYDPAVMDEQMKAMFRAGVRAILAALKPASSQTARPTIFGMPVHIVPDFPDGGVLMTDGKHSVALIDKPAEPECCVCIAPEPAKCVRSHGMPLCLECNKPIKPIRLAGEARP